MEQDLVAIGTAIRTLRSWMITEEEIDAVRHEADAIHSRKGQSDSKLNDTWARVEICAPWDGTIVERNYGLGDFVSTNLEIFKIADLTQLQLLANIYEEDLPGLEQLADSEKCWTVFLKTDRKMAPLAGRFNRIGNLVDPIMHTALIEGWVDNTNRQMRIGQFVTVKIEYPKAFDEVAIPLSALIEMDSGSYVFVRSEADHCKFVRHRVLPVRHCADSICVQSVTADGESGHNDCQLNQNDWVVEAGTADVAAEWERLTKVLDLDMATHHAKLK